jgi:hypothetical protein
MTIPSQRKIIREIQRLHARRVPLNISAFKWSHPKLIERVYAVRPFWDWKRTLEDARLALRSKKIEKEKWGQPLLLRAQTLLGSWNAALLAAGIDPHFQKFAPCPSR